MAHANINERRQAVARVLAATNGVLSWRAVLTLAEAFGCSESAIRADVEALTQKKLRPALKI
jgi:DeoR/GlpR family transcriptional regulator of sugar metabolism